MQLVSCNLHQNWWIPALAKFGAFLASNSKKIAKKFLSQPKSKIFLGCPNETILTTFWLQKDSCIFFTSPSVEIFQISLLGQSSLKPLEIQWCQILWKNHHFSTGFNLHCLLFSYQHPNIWKSQFLDFLPDMRFQEAFSPWRKGSIKKRTPLLLLQLFEAMK